MSQRIVTERGKVIDVFDDLMPMDWRFFCYEFAVKSMYRIGWYDTELPERRPYDNPLASIYTPEDMAMLGLYDCIADTPIAAALEGLSPKTAVMNLVTPSTISFVHTHQQKKVLLYYVNMEWKEGWLGETLYYSEDGRSIPFASPYVPGRFIVFDGPIPHTIRPQSYIAPMLRFTLSVTYEAT